MNNLVVQPANLANLTKQIIKGLLMRNSQCQVKSYCKIDVKIVEEDLFCTVQVTKCGPGHPNLKFLIVTAFNDLLEVEKNISIKKRTALAVIIKKTETDEKKVTVRKVIGNEDLSFSCVTNCTENYNHLLWKELSCLKQYILIKMEFQVLKDQLEELSSRLKQDILEVQTIDPNVKFILRKDDTHIYRNRVKMDSIVLSCQILSSALRSIFDQSTNREFRKDIMKALGTKKSHSVESIIGSLLLAKANPNLIPTLKTSSSMQKNLNKENKSSNNHGE